MKTPHDSLRLVTKMCIGFTIINALGAMLMLTVSGSGAMLLGGVVLLITAKLWFVISCTLHYMKIILINVEQNHQQLSEIIKYEIAAVVPIIADKVVPIIAEKVVPIINSNSKRKKE